MKNPCYDTTTHTDCPDRCVGCAVTCEKWSKYVTERNNQYIENEKRMKSEQDYTQYVQHNIFRYTNKPKKHTIGGIQ